MTVNGTAGHMLDSSLERRMVIKLSEYRGEPSIPIARRREFTMIGVATDATSNRFAAGVSPHSAMQERSILARLDTSGMEKFLAFASSVSAPNNHLICCADTRFTDQLFAQIKDHSFTHSPAIIPNFFVFLDEHFAELGGISSAAAESFPGRQPLFMMPFPNDVAAAFFKCVYNESGGLKDHAVCVANIALNEDVYLYLTLPANPPSAADIVYYLKEEGSHSSSVVGDGQLFAMQKGEKYKAVRDISIVASSFVTQLALNAHLPHFIRMKLALLHACRSANLELTYEPRFLGVR